MSRNPYLDESGSPQLIRSVFAFIDILGYGDIVSASIKSGTQFDLLQRLHLALSRGRGWLQEWPPEHQDLKPLFSKDMYVLKAFSDNIVIAWPVAKGDAEGELGLIFSKLIDFQFSMSVEGFFVRGGISIGNAFVDDFVVFGDALIQAYKGESQFARDPRIILTPDAVDAVKKHITYYADQSHAPQNKYVLCDSDGQWFINYLEAVLISEYDHGPYYEEFVQHKTAVEYKLTEHRGNPPVFSKYAWVAGYHNYFCDLHSDYFSAVHKIDIELYNARPSLIVS